jgi:hypothetical protein
MEFHSMVLFVPYDSNRVNPKAAPPKRSPESDDNMTVQELIAHLKGLPPNDLVLVEGYESGWDTLISVERGQAVRQSPCHEWDGEYERTTASGDGSVESVLLMGRRGHLREPNHFVGNS